MAALVESQHRGGEFKQTTARLAKQLRAMAELDENRALQTLVAKRVPRAYPLTRSAAARHRALTQKIRDALTELHMAVTSSDEANTHALLH